MRALRAFFARLAGWRNRESRESQLAAELESHFQMHVDDNVRAGMRPEQARRAAALRFGGVDSAKEAVRSQWTVTFLENTRQDIVYGLRGLRRNPGFAATSILSLALGIGSAIAIFTVVDSLLLRPLPYREPDRLVMVWEARKGRSHNNVIAPANYLDWKAQNSVFESIGVLGTGRVVLQDGTRVDEMGIQFMSFDVLPLLGVQPWRGRLFTQAEDMPNAPSVAIISYRLWQEWFAGDEAVLGRKVQIGSQPATVVGVMPPGFYFRKRDIDLWTTVNLDPARDYRKSSGRYLDGVARLKRGVSFAAAQSQMTAIAKRLEADYPLFDTNWTVELEPLRDSMVREVKTSMWVLLGAVSLLLAVACANVANLLLARYTSRRREMSVRAAIGAGRGRVMRQLLTESLVLGLSGGVIGLALARALVVGLVMLAPRDLVRNAVIAVDLRIVGFSLLLSLLTGVVFGLAPAFAALRADPVDGLRDGARSSTGGHRGLRDVLVAAEVALSLMLLTGAGLLFRTLVGLQSVDPGLNASNVLTFRVSIPGAKYREPLQRLQFFERGLEGMRALPGVVSVSSINYLPFNGMASGTRIRIAGRPPAKPGEEPTSTIRTVMPGYFRAMGVPLTRGRDFNSADNSLAVPYRFIVNETFVRRYMAGENPLGQSISANMQDENPFGEIVGVVGDVKEGSLDKEPSPTIYYNEAHMASTTMFFILRTQGDPMALAEPARRVIRELDAQQPVADVRPMDEVVRETFARQRFSAVLLVGFSVVAVVLAAVGIFGVLAYSVTERTREIGVRMALGADAVRVVVMVLGSGARVVAVGMIAGLGGAFALTGLLKTMLFGVEAHDTATFAGVPLLLAVVAMIAAYLPARRASRVAPAEALRAD